MPRRPKGSTDKHIARKYTNAIYKSDGSYASIALHLGVSVHAVKQYIFKHPRYKEIIKIRKQLLVDNAESILCQLVDTGYFPAVKFALERLDKSYKDTSDSANASNQINITLSTNDNNNPNKKYSSVEELVNEVKNEG